MKIAIITPGFLPVPAVNGGAIEEQITNFIEENEKYKRYILDVYTIEHIKLKELSYNYCNIIPIKVSNFSKIICRIKNLLLNLFKKDRAYHIAFGDILIKNYLKEDYDFIIVENNMPLFEDILTKTKYNSKHLIFHLHNDVGSSSKPKYLCNLINENSKMILTVSEFIKNSFQEKCNQKKADIKVLYNTIDYNIFDSKLTNNKFDYRKIYGIHPNEIVILFAGRITPEKGIKELLLAFESIKDKDNIKLLIVGDEWFSGTRKSSFKKELVLICNSFKDKVIFTGYIDSKEMPKIYALSDIVVVPSLCNEAFCLVALEAMAMGLPLIITNSGGMLEVVDENCAIVLNRDFNLTNNLEKSLVKLINNQAIRENMRKNALLRAKHIKCFNKNYYFNQFSKYISS